MANILRIHSLLACVSLLLVAGCDLYSITDEGSQAYSRLEPKNLVDMQEVASWALEKNTPISIITYSDSLNKITAVSEAGGMIANIDIASKQVTHKNVTDMPGFQALGIDQDGRVLLGARLDETQVKDSVQEYLKWVAAFDVNTGSIIECFSISCTEDSDMLHPSSDIGATIDFNGETVVTYNEDAYRVIKLSNSSYSGFALVNSPDADYWWHIGKMAMDSRHSRLAIVFQEGRITVEGILAPRIFPLSRIDVLENGTKHELQPVEFAAFDPSGKWLAVVRADELSIWSVANWKKAIIYQAPIRNVSGIEFNPSGELLFVATDNEIRAIGLEKKELIFEFDAPGVSSLHVDEDNRLLFWGDEEGVIHIRGVLRKN